MRSIAARHIKTYADLTTNAQQALITASHETQSIHNSVLPTTNLLYLPQKNHCGNLNFIASQLKYNNNNKGLHHD